MLCLLCRNPTQKNYMSNFNCMSNIEEKDERLRDGIICRKCREKNNLDNLNYLIIEKLNEGKCEYYKFPFKYLISCVGEHNQLNKIN